MTKSRIVDICKDINSKKYTTTDDIANHHKIGKYFPKVFSDAGLIWKENGYYKAMQRVSDERFNTFNNKKRIYYKTLIKQIPQPTLFDSKKSMKAKPKKVVNPTLKKFGIIQRVKILFTGKV